MLNANDQMDILKSSRAEFHPLEEMTAKLNQKRPLRVKYGIDPTGKHVHLGHTVPLLKLKQLQKIGHKAVIIIGDFTARIGDPTGRDETRPPLTLQQVKENSSTYLLQISKIIDMKEAEIQFNSMWLSELKAEQIIKIMSTSTVQQLLHRDDFSKRMESQKPIHMQELMYPFLQAYDSVHVKADIELGGTEQLFTLMLARELQRDAQQEPQVCITLPILRGMDGERRMGKSLGNYIALDEPAYEMFAKTMSIPDELMPEWFDLLTNLRNQVCRNNTGQILSPMATKKTLAYNITAFYHGCDEASKASFEWHHRFTEKGDPTEIEEVVIPADCGKELWVCRLLTVLGLTKSHSEARKLIVPSSGVTVGPDRRRVVDPNEKITLEDGLIVRVGQRRVAKVRLEKPEVSV